MVLSTAISRGYSQGGTRCRLYQIEAAIHTHPRQVPPTNHSLMFQLLNVGIGLPASAPWRRYDLPGTSTCLDGTPAAFYVRPPLIQRTNETKSFVIFFEGGGWCNSPIDCVIRTQTNFGSSSKYVRDGTKRFGSNPFITGVNARLGAEFATSGIAHAKYCDGASFAGNSRISLNAAHGPVQIGKWQVNQSDTVVIGSNGRKIVETMIAKLLADGAPHGLQYATDVLLSGCSAGGLAVLLNAESIYRQISAFSNKPLRVKVMVFSGIFHASEASPYALQMRNVFEHANMKDAISPACLNRSPLHANEPWRCIINLEPLEALPSHISVFVEQSAFDSWQTSCVVGAKYSQYTRVGCKAGEWDQCLDYVGHHVAQAQGRNSGSESGQCAEVQLQSLDSFSQTFRHELMNSEALRRPGSGSFIHGCHSHCPGDLSKFIISGKSLERAIVNWWRAPLSELADAHTYVGCLMHWAKDGGNSCRPTCSTLDPPRKGNLSALATRIRSVARAFRGELTSEESLIS